jgi:hypothetical protein
MIAAASGWTRKSPTRSINVVSSLSPAPVCVSSSKFSCTECRLHTPFYPRVIAVGFPQRLSGITATDSHPKVLPDYYPARLTEGSIRNYRAQQKGVSGGWKSILFLSTAALSPSISIGIQLRKITYRSPGADDVLSSYEHRTGPDHRKLVSALSTSMAMSKRSNRRPGTG